MLRNTLVGGVGCDLPCEHDFPILLALILADACSQVQKRRFVTRPGFLRANYAYRDAIETRDQNRAVRKPALST